jgi:5'-nucleotidase (lipoprotein e(P4) family)
MFALSCVSCATPPAAPQAGADPGILWIKHSAEYRALSRQVYQAAELAIPRLVADTGFSALPGQAGAGLPPAVILDVDETTVSNVDFQLTYVPPFADWKLNAWADQTIATPVPGVAGFVAAARAAGVAVFFVTNRPCEPIEGIADACPQKAVTIRDIGEAGIETDASHVLLSGENGWTKEKVTRREYLAERYRIIMLFGDDLGDFIACARGKLYPPCTERVSAGTREELVDRYGDYWGNGWYVLPNPMHGSWTSALP